MFKILTALKSRTAWTVALMFVIGGVDGVRELIPADMLPVVEGVLGLAAVYFRVNRRADKV